MLTYISEGLPKGASAQSIRGIKANNRQMKTLISYDSNEIQIITADVSIGASPTFQNLERHVFPLATGAIYTQLSFDFLSGTAFVFERNKLTGYQSSSNIFESTLDFGDFDSISNVRILDSREYAGNIEWLINVVGTRDGIETAGSIGTYIVRINSDFSSAPIEISAVELPFDSSNHRVNGTFTRDYGVTLTSGDSLMLFSESLSPLWTTTVATDGESMVVTAVDNEIWMLSVNQSAPDESSRLYLNRFDYTGDQISSRMFATNAGTEGEIHFGQPIIDEFGNLLISFISRESATVEEIIVFVDFEGNPKLIDELSRPETVISDAGINSGLTRYTRNGNDLINVGGYNGGTSFLYVREINRQGY